MKGDQNASAEKALSEYPEIPNYIIESGPVQGGMAQVFIARHQRLNR